MFTRFITALSLFCFLSNTAAADNTPTGPKAVYHSGWIEYVGEYPLVHMKGDEREMGEQLGYLAGDILKANIDNLKTIGEKDVGGFLKYVPNFIFNGLRRFVGFFFWEKFSDDVREHIRGVVAGAKKRHIKLHALDLAFENALIDITGILNGIGDSLGKKPGTFDVVKFFLVPAINSNCDTFAAWGTRTVDGKTFQTRNTDIDTGKGIEKYPLMMIMKKDDKIPVISTAMAGMLGVFAGMNAYGVGLGQVWAHSYKFKLHNPWQLQIREAFMDARNAREATELFARMGNTTYGNNFVFADGGDGTTGMQSEAYAVETNSKNIAVFVANDPGELVLKYDGQTVGLPIPYAIARADLSMDPTIRKVQTSSNGPNGDPRTANAYIQRYLGQVSRILDYEQQGVLIGPGQAIEISKATAARGGNLINAVYANTDRNLWVTYSKMNADGTTSQAFEREYVNVPFYQYLPTLRYDGRYHELRIQTYPVNPRFDRVVDLTVNIIRHFQNQTTTEKIATGIKTDQEYIQVPLSTMLRPGDVFELRETNTGVLVDLQQL